MIESVLTEGDWIMEPFLTDGDWIMEPFLAGRLDNSETHRMIDTVKGNDNNKLKISNLHANEAYNKHDIRSALSVSCWPVHKSNMVLITPAVLTFPARSLVHIL